MLSITSDLIILFSQCTTYHLYKSTCQIFQIKFDGTAVFSCNWYFWRYFSSMNLFI